MLLAACKASCNFNENTDNFIFPLTTCISAVSLDRRKCPRWSWSVEETIASANCKMYKQF